MQSNKAPFFAFIVIFTSVFSNAEVAAERIPCHGKSVYVKAFTPCWRFESIGLPTTRARFIGFLEKIGASWYYAGDIPGAKLPIAPPSFHGTSCYGNRAIGFYFPNVDATAVQRRFVAYMNRRSAVVCVENQTLTPSL